MIELGHVTSARVQRLDAAGQPVGEPVPISLGALNIAVAIDSLFEAFKQAARQFAVAIGPLLDLFAAIAPTPDRYAIERMGVPESDIRTWHADYSGGESWVQLWNHRRITLPADWWRESGSQP